MDEIGMSLKELKERTLLFANSLIIKSDIIKYLVEKGYHNPYSSLYNNLKDESFSVWSYNNGMSFSFIHGSLNISGAVRFYSSAGFAVSGYCGIIEFQLNSVAEFIAFENSITELIDIYNKSTKKLLFIINGKYINGKLLLESVTGPNRKDSFIEFVPLFHDKGIDLVILEKISKKKVISLYELYESTGINKSKIKFVTTIDSSKKYMNYPDMRALQFMLFRKMNCSCFSDLLKEKGWCDLWKI